MPDPLQTQPLQSKSLSGNGSPHRLGYRAGTWSDLLYNQQRWLRSKFTREQVISNLKTLAWVLPLTLLIWVYAEREQIATYKDETIPFELNSVDPNRVVSLTRKQDKNLIVDLQGPQGRVQEVLQRLRGGRLADPAATMGLLIDVPPGLSPNRVHELPMISTLQRQPIFNDYGITVVGCQPSQLEIMIDEVVEPDATIVPKPTVKNLEPTSAFDPPRVKLRGPRSVLDAAAQQDGGKLLVYAEIPENVLKEPGHHDLAEGVSLARPPNLLDDRVTIQQSGKIQAHLDVRASDVAGVIPSMPVQPIAPAQFWDKYKMDPAVFKGFVQNVHVTGPKEIIDHINDPNFAPKPLAILMLSTDDATGDVRSKVVRYFNTPQGVNLSDEDLKRTVEFRLVERGAGE